MLLDKSYLRVVVDQHENTSKSFVSLAVETLIHLYIGDETLECRNL